jgi:hypothetical protein
MSDEKRIDIGRLMIEGTLIDEAMRKAVRDAVLLHKRLGDPIVGSRDGKIVWIPADEIEVDEDTTEGSSSG